MEDFICKRLSENFLLHIFMIANLNINSNWLASQFISTVLYKKIDRYYLPGKTDESQKNTVPKITFQGI